FLHFEHAQWGIALRGGVVPKGVLGITEDVAFVPGLPEVMTMVNGDAVEPSSAGGLAAELVHFAESLEENVVGGVLRLLGITQHAEGQVINGPAMGLVELS